MPPIDVAEYLKTAAGHLRAGRIKEAQAAYHTLLKADHRGQAALEGMARIAFARARPETALMFIDRIAEEVALTPQQRYLLAHVHLLSGHASEAKMLFAELKTLQPKNVELLCNLASSHRHSGEDETARQIYEEAAGIDPESAQPVTGLGWLAYDMRKFADAEKFLKRALSLETSHFDVALLNASIRDEQGMIAQSANELFQAVQKAPHDPLFTVLLSSVMFAQDSQLEAMRMLKDVILNFPALTPAWLLSARINLVRGNAVLAKADASKAGELAPWSHQVTAQVKMIHQQADRTEMIPKSESQNKTVTVLSEGYIENLRAAAEHTPDDVPLRLRLVTELIDAKELLEAADLVQHVIGDNRRNSHAHHLFAKILTRTGQWPEAEDFAQKAVKLAPKSAEAWAQLADVLNRQEKYLDADKAARRSLALDANSVFANHVQARIKAKLERFDEAERQFRLVLTLDPAYVDTLAGLTTLFYEQGRLDEALEMSGRTLQIQPDRHQILSVTGQIHEQLGDLEAAEKAHQAAIAAKPDYAEGYFQLANLHRFTKDDPLVAEMERVRSLEQLDMTDRSNINFALANAYHRQSRFPEAFASYTKGNQALVEGTNYDPAEILRRVAAIKETFDQAFMDDHEGLANSDETPIFVLGMPRSGTTLCEQILSSHNDIFGAGELVQISSFAVNDMPKISLGRYPEWTDYLSASQLNDFASKFIATLREISPDTRFVTDKTPGNFIYIGLIRLAFPKAKIIHCHRDPMDNCLSMFRTAFAGRHYYTCNLEHLGNYYNAYVEVMNHWHELIPGEIYDWQYEAVVNDIEGETRALLDFLDLDWDENCLQFYRSSRPVNTASVVQVRQPIYASSLGGWRKYETELAPLKKILAAGPHLAHMS